MKKSIYYLILFLSISLLYSCEEDDPVIVNPEISIEAENKPAPEELSLPQDVSMTLSAKVENTKNYTLSWKVDGKEVSTDNEFKFIATELGEHTIILDVLNHDGGKATARITILVNGKYKNGTFVLNEGNMTVEQGSLIFISPEGSVTDSAYWHANNSFLGNATQDLYITDNKMYIISQNGGGDGMLVVANAETLKKEAGYSKEDMSPLSMPSNIAVVKNNAYIRDNKGVYSFDLTSKTMKFIEGSNGAAKNHMAVISDKVFVPAGKKIYVIKDGAIEQTIDMPGKVSGIIKASDNNVWVSCTTSPAQINKVNSSDYSIIQKNELPADVKISSGSGASPGISAKEDTIYFSNASTKIYYHIFNQNKTEYLTDVKEHIENAGIVYNNLAVHPTTGEVYFNTIKGYGNNFLTNDITIFNLSGSTPVLKADYKNHTHFPSGVFFTDSYK